LKLWKQKVSKFCATSKPDGLTWLLQARWYILEEFKILLVKMVEKIVVNDLVASCIQPTSHENDNSHLALTCFNMK
jgi:hypothetical protein